MTVEWREEQIGNICKQICSGGTPKSTNIEYYTNGTIPWLNTKEINFNRIFHTEKNITEKALNSSSAKWIEADSIIVALYGETAGKVAITKIALTTNQACCNLTIDPNKADYNYIYYFLKNKNQSLINLKNGGAQQNLNVKIIKEFSIRLPPLPVQKKIAAILSSLDDKIELNTRMNNVLEEIARALFRRWFVEFEFPNAEGKPYKSAGGKMVESEMGSVPEGWNVRKLNDISKEIICGKTPSTKILEYYGNSTPFITIPDMHNQVYAISTERYLSINGVQSQPKKTIPKNSICVSCIATPGLVCLTAKNSQTNQQINSIVCKDEISPYFIYFSMLNISEFICTLGSSGSTTSNLNKGQFSKIKLIIPSCEIMKEFDKITSPIFKQIKGNQIESQMLTEVRDTLLPKLMSGEIEV